VSRFGKKKKTNPLKSLKNAFFLQKKKKCQKKDCQNGFDLNILGNKQPLLGNNNKKRERI